MKQFEELHGGLDKYQWKNLDTQITGMTLKHVVQQYCTYDDSAIMREVNGWN
jgi:hypothetical protein